MLACLFPGIALGQQQSPPLHAKSFDLRALVQYRDPTGVEELLFSSGVFDIQGFDNNGNLFLSAGFFAQNPVRGLTGLFRLDAEGWHELAREPVNSGLLQYSRPSVNEAGQIVFQQHKAEYNGMRFVPALSVYEDGQVRDLLVTSDLFPGTTSTVKHMSIVPTINARGDIGLEIQNRSLDGQDEYGIYVYSGSEFRRLVAHGDPTPAGGVFMLDFGPLPTVCLDDNGNALFLAIVAGGSAAYRLGLFRATRDGVEQVVLEGDPLPSGRRSGPGQAGTMNGQGDVAFSTTFLRQSDPDRFSGTGIFYWSKGTTRLLVASGDPAPDGGTFLPLYKGKTSGYGLARQTALINDRGEVLFASPVKKPDGSKVMGLYLVRDGRVLKVAAAGDKLPDRSRLCNVGAYALNDLGQVVFIGLTRSEDGSCYYHGIYLATPR